MRTLLFVVLTAAAYGQEGAQQIAELGSCPLLSGEAIQDCRVGYRTFGTLNADRSNAVVMPTWLNGRSEDLASLFGKKPGPSRLVDTSRFFGIAFDAFGNGVSSSPSNSKAQHGPAFPVFNMEDMARAQYRVVTEVLKIPHLHAVLGLSMGGEQTFAWAAQYPKFVDLAVPILGTPQVTNFDRLSKQIIIDAINSDPGYNGGNYSSQPPLKLANAIGVQMLTTPRYRNTEAPRDHFAQWLQSIEAPQRQDANDRMWQAKAIRPGRHRLSFWWSWPRKTAW